MLLFPVLAFIGLMKRTGNLEQSHTAKCLKTIAKRAIQILTTIFVLCIFALCIFRTSAPD